MASQARQRKLADRIKVIVAETLELKVKDPRVGFITVTDVRVTPDLREASVFYTVYGDDEQRESTRIALDSARGLLRSEVGRQTGIKFTPSLTFIPDALPDEARHVEELLKQAQVADEQVHERAVGATYAGDPDPYRQERRAEDE
jgi:ribosome-binding factor A